MEIEEAIRYIRGREGGRRSRTIISEGGEGGTIY